MADVNALKLKIRSLEKDLKRERKLTQNLRKYKFQVIDMKSQIRTLIKHKNAAPPKIKNLFQFLRDNDYDAYLHLEKMLLPFSCENRMSVIHKSIRQPDWVIKNHENELGKYWTPSRDWLRLVRNPHIHYKAFDTRDNSPGINIHGVMLESQDKWNYGTHYSKVEILDSSVTMMTKLKDLGVDVKVSWTKKKMYEKLMELDK